MAIGDLTRKAREAIEAREADEGIPPASALLWTPDQLRAIVAAGMPISEATQLLGMGYSADLVLELAQTQATQRTQAATDVQTATAKAMKKAMRPENEYHPAMSSFSYPEGDREHPKVTPPFDIEWNGYPFHKFMETVHWREAELIAKLTPGTFTVLRKDASKMAITVNAERDADGNVTRLMVNFPLSRDEKWLCPSLISVLYQLVHADGNPRQRFVESMNEYMNHTLWQSPAMV